MNIIKNILRLFKRTKIEGWEIAMLKNIISALPNDYFFLNNQINDGLLKDVTFIEHKNHIVSFGYDLNITDRYIKLTESGYNLLGIQIFDRISNGYLDCSIFICYGLVSTYTVHTSKKFNLDVNLIKVEGFKKKFLESPDFEKIKHLFTTSELSYIDSSDVYELDLQEDKTYYHLVYCEDGDFIGIDAYKNPYYFTHDPYEIRAIDISLLKVLKLLKEGANPEILVS